MSHIGDYLKLDYRWEALIFYLYTSQISFAALTSCKSGLEAAERAPSPKSMYRLADKVSQLVQFTLRVFIFERG